jgi:hypothetical protein
MAVSARLSHKFHDVLGAEAAEDLVTWMDNVESHHDELRADFAELRADFAEFRHEMRSNFAEFREEMNGKFMGLELRVSERMASHDVKLAETQVYLERALKEQSRWFVATWAIQLAAIAGLYALILQRLH